LKDPHFRADFQALVEKTHKQVDHTDPDWEVWDTFKTRIKNLIIAHSMRLSVNRKIHTAQLLKRLNFLHEINETQPGCANDEIDKVTVEL
jgi:hypothetical protein